MTREWAPGDVADVCNEHGVWNRAIYSVTPGGFVWKFGVSDSTAPRAAKAQPLLVIDPEDRERVERLADVIAKSGAHRGRVAKSAETNALQAALRSLVAPPKPDEPTGLGAVVEDGEGNKWSQGTYWSPGVIWMCVDHDSDEPYANIAAVRILSDGVS